MSLPSICENFFRKDITKSDYLVFSKAFLTTHDQKLEEKYFVNSLQYIDYDVGLNNLYKNHFNGHDKIDYEQILNTFIESPKRISIVMTHKNRPELLFLTLLSIEKSSAKNFEVIIVDDNSSIDKLPNYLKYFKFSFLIKYIVLTDHSGLPDRNSCQAFNTGFDSSNGDVIVIQNCECLHLGDIITEINYNFNYDDYLSFPCYSSNNKSINNLILSNLDKISISNIETMTKKENIDHTMPQFPIWFQHRIKNNRNLHFCTVISTNYLKIIGGFSNLYENGIGYEDDDFVFRIKELKLNIISIDTDRNIGVVHQFHGYRANCVSTPYKGHDGHSLSLIKKYRLNGLIDEQVHMAKPFYTPKIMHYYWDDFKKFTYYNYLSLLTAIHYHQDWIHIVWMPNQVNNHITWKEFCNKDQIYNSNYNKYIDHLKTFKNLRIFKINECAIFNLPIEMSEIHKKDIISYQMIYIFGGIWSDLDIVYIKNISGLIVSDFDNLICKCVGPSPSFYVFFPVGFFCSKRKTQLFQQITTNILDFYNKDRYQCLGSEMLGNSKFFGNQSDTQLINLFGETNMIVSNNLYMAYLWFPTDIKILFDDFKKDDVRDLSKTLGIHWFNGSDVTKKYLEMYEHIGDHTKGLLNSLTTQFKGKTNIYILNFNNLDTNIYQYYLNIKKYYYNVCAKVFKTIEIDISGLGPMNIQSYFKYTNGSDLYVFGPLDYVFLMINYMLGDKKVCLDILNNITYLIYFEEIFMNKTLQHIGLSTFDPNFAKLFFLNASKILICNIQNKIYLLENKIPNANIIYHPPYGYSEINDIIPLKSSLLKDIDLLIYHNVHKNTQFPYRENLVRKVKEYSQEKGYNLINPERLYGQDKDGQLARTKIVIHIPSHDCVTSIPWAKITELMSKKVFFIIEENDEIFCQNLQTTFVSYKKGDDNDLLNKLDYYLINDKKREEYIEKNYNYVKTKYNFDQNLISIINNI